MKCNLKECKKNHEIYDALTLTVEEIANLDTSIHHLLQEGFAGATEDSLTIKEWYYPLASTGIEVKSQGVESEDDENYHCLQCDKEIFEEEFLENSGLCNRCSRLPH